MIYYKASWHATDEGLIISFDEWQCFHETPSYAYCTTPSWMVSLGYRQSTSDRKISDLKLLKQMGAEIKRINKNGSRFAHPTKERALQHMLFRQRKRLQHLKRDMRFIEHILDKVSVLDDLQMTRWGAMVAPDSRDEVNQHLRFD